MPVCLYTCGNCTEIIGDLIETGVNIPDYVQAPAKNMGLENPGAKFGKIFSKMLLTL
jgi:hypothetical protein